MAKFIEIGQGLYNVDKIILIRLIPSLYTNDTHPYSIRIAQDTSNGVEVDDIPYPSEEEARRDFTAIVESL